MTTREIEETMSIAEYREYEEYLAKNPPHKEVSEIQNASLLLLASSLRGAKKPNINDFFVSAKFKIKEIKNRGKSVADMTADEINKILGL